MTRRSIANAVTDGDLIRARRDRYLPRDTPDEIVRAVRVGGRLTCVSLLRALGIFVLSRPVLHVHLHPTDSRPRSPHDRRRRLEPTNRRGVRPHWRPLGDDVGQEGSVSLIDALAHAAFCQEPRAMIATLDSALNTGLLRRDQLSEVFALLPERFRVLEPLIDGRSEAGSESLMRVRIRAMGLDVQVQVEIPDVGRVDLLVDGWLIVECDSKQFHESWEAQLRDRQRDIAAAAAGYVTLRLPAKTVFDNPEAAAAAVRGLCAARAARG